jgi:hypothetical protein
LSGRKRNRLGEFFWSRFLPARSTVISTAMRVLVGAALLLLVPLTAPGATLQPRTTLVSVGYGGEWANRNSYAAKISADGRFVAFSSTATNLTPTRRSGTFIRNLDAKKTTWLSPAALGILDMTPSARFLLLCTPVPLVTADVRPAPGQPLGRYFDAYVYDRKRKVAIRASVPIRGRNPNEWACGDDRTANLDAAISDDGRRVAFQAGASNLVRGDRNRSDDIFVRDLAAERTYRVPIPGRTGRLLRGPTMSGNGRFVFFGQRVRFAGRPYTDHAYVHDLVTRRTRLISTAPNGRPLTEGGYVAQASTSGRFVLVATASPELTGDLENARLPIAQWFVKDLKTGAHDLVTRGIDGKGFDGSMFGSAISADARYLALATEAGNAVPGDTNRKIDVVWIDRVRDITVRVSVRPDGREHDWTFGHGMPAISADGRWISWSSSDPDFWPGEPRHPPPYEYTEDVFIRGPMH